MEKLQVVLVFMVIVNCSESCKPYYECKVIRECSRMIHLLQSRNEGDLEVLRKSNCGYVGKEPMVCCPKLPCWTPDGKEGDCMSIHDCPAIKSLRQSYLSTTSTETSKILNEIPKSRFRCLNIENGVCCPFPPRPTQLEHKPRNLKQNCPASDLPPKPDSNCCGVEPEVGHRISRGEPALLHQYTWLAVLEYNDPQFHCAGSLISGLYVLTAAHCVFEAKPVSVLLGEYDRSNPGRDCKESNNTGQTCMESQQISINKIISHPKFSWKRGLPFPNDIALLRLSNMANLSEAQLRKRAGPYEAVFTECIRPICLPSVAVRFGQDSKLISAGWGATESQGYSNIKMAVGLSFLETKECAENIKRKLGEGHMCTGNTHGEGPCEGDSGGPLMHQTEGRFEAVGVHSFGTSQCGVKGVPHGFTNVIQYVPWINESIKKHKSP